MGELPGPLVPSAAVKVIANIPGLWPDTKANFHRPGLDARARGWAGKRGVGWALQGAGRGASDPGPESGFRSRGPGAQPGSVTYHLGFLCLGVLCCRYGSPCPSGASKGLPRGKSASIRTPPPPPRPLASRSVSSLPAQPDLPGRVLSARRQPRFARKLILEVRGRDPG